MSEVILATATAAKTGSTTTVQINGQIVTVQVARDLTVAANDVLVLTKVGSQWFALTRHFPTAVVDPVPDTPPPGVPASTSGKNSFAAVETRSFRNGAWRNDNDYVYQGQFGGNGNHTGCAFYGNGPRSLAGATVTGASIVVHRRNSGGITAPQTTTMRLVTEKFRPGGAPTLTSSTTGPTLGWGGTNTAFPVPTAWAQSMVDGTAGGIGFFTSSGSPYVIFSGKSDYGPAFTLTIAWSR